MVQKSQAAPPSSPIRASRSPSRGRPKRADSKTRSVGRPRKDSPGRPRKDSPSRLKNPSSARKVSPVRTASPSRKYTPRAKKEETSVKSVDTAASSRVVVSPKPRNPIGKSPPRTITSVTKSAETYYSERVQRPSRRTVLDADTDSDSVDASPKKTHLRSYKAPQEKTNSDDKLSNDSSLSSFNLTKRVSSASRNQNREIERIVHVNTFDNAAKKLSEFSDEDEVAQKYLRKSESKSIDLGSDFQQISEFGGTLGALFWTLMVPFAGIALFVTCNETHCSFTKIPPYKKYLQVGTYFNLTAGLAVLAFAIITAICTALPFGGKKIVGLATKQGKFTYVLNGPFTLILILAIAAGLEFKGIPIANFIAKHTFELFVASFLCGLALIVWVHLRSFNEPLSSLNAHCLGKSWIYGFFMGRDLNPRLFGLVDLKIYVLRVSLIGSVLINFVYIYRDLKWVTHTDNVVFLKVNPTLVVLVIIESIYLLDHVLLERTWITSFEIQYEGFGYMSAVGYFVYPFMASSLPKYVADYNVQLDNWKLVLIALLFVVGYVFFRGSNSQKDAFRRNPYDPSFSHMETIPTTKGKKLLCSGFWGIVRHPNYLGDILINISFIPFVLGVPPVLNQYAIILLLLHRSVRDHARCKQKYGAAWERYCNKVKYVLVPKVY